MCGADMISSILEFVFMDEWLEMLMRWGFVS